MLALAFLLMIGFALVADGVGFHIPRAYLYTAMAFSAGGRSAQRLRQRATARTNGGMSDPQAPATAPSAPAGSRRRRLIMAVFFVQAVAMTNWSRVFPTCSSVSA